jgi:arylsulfatase A-like enzyme
VSRSVRFTFIVGLAALATALAAVSGWRFARASAPLSGPIVIVSIDTLRADRLPAYGYGGVRTPAIDALAADGILFERAYAHAPQTLPAHASILTGRLPFETGVRDNVGFSLKPTERSLAQMLRERGYATGAVVSAFALRKATGIAQGFDYFDGEMTAGATAGTVGRLKRDGGASETLAERWLTSIGSSRALLFLQIDEPHKPYALPDRFAEAPPYDAAVAYSDEIVGHLVHYLKSHQLYDRSTIVLLSDHGEGLGDHGEQQHGLFLYEEDLHVPLVIKQEGNAGAGRRVRDLVQQIDLVPTILELVKAPVPGNLRGRSLKPLLDGTAHLDARFVYSEAMYGRYHFGWSELVAITDEQYRYVKAPDAELYDLGLDPHERQNLAPQRPELLGPLRAALDRSGATAPLPMPADESGTDANERLQALGYLGGRKPAPDPAVEVLPDPKERRQILETYREALDLAGHRSWREAIARLQQLLRDDPGLPELWNQLAGLAERLDRFDVAADAYKHSAELEPTSAAAYLRAAAALLKQRKFEDARTEAARASEIAADADRGSRAEAHALLARIALARRDADAARDEAARAHAADSRMPLPAFVDARLLYDQGRFDDALPLFEEAVEQQRKSGGPAMADLHYYAGETYSRLERYSEAETEYAAELGEFPLNVRARGGLAMALHALGQPDAAARAIGDMTDLVPTTESYTLAARLWTLVGNRLQADAVRAELRERSADALRRGAAPQ